VKKRKLNEKERSMKSDQKSYTKKHNKRTEHTEIRTGTCTEAICDDDCFVKPERKTVESGVQYLTTNIPESERIQRNSLISVRLEHKDDNGF
jgi:hypothetical protein